jgi:hypothetical protein
MLYSMRQMLENSASEQIYSASQRIYEDLPVAKILESCPETQSAFAASIERVAGVLTNIAKIGALVSLPVGIILLLSYLRDEGAPMPAADTSISVLLWLVCVIFMFITLLPTSILLMPALAKISSPAKSEAPPDSAKRKRKRSTAWQQAKQYYLRFGPYLSVVLYTFVAIGLFQNPKSQCIAITIGVVSLAGYFLVRHRTGYPGCQYVLQSSVHSLLSFAVLLVLVSAVVQQVDPHMHTWEVALVCVGIPLVIHLATVTWVTDWKMVLFCHVV